MILYIRERDVAAYIDQGWECIRLLGHHGARKNGRNFMAIYGL